jgi:hypothetical protein
MTEWGGEESMPFVFDEILPLERAFSSLLSICKGLPMNVKIIFSQNKYNLKARTKYKERVERRIKQYRDKKSIFLPIFEEEYKNLCAWMEKERKVRTYMKILFSKWLQRKCKNRLLNTDDPCTLSPPVKLIKFFDPACRGFYIFEASSLKKQFETALQYSEWLFPKPSHPKNPLTNISFNEGQSILIVDSLRKHGYGSWFIEAYRSVGWNITNFTKDNSTSLKINAITQLCKNPNHETLEFLDEFIVNQFEANDLNNLPIKSTLRWAVKHKLDDDYMKRWLTLMKDYYVIKYRNNITDDNNTKLNAIYVRSMQLFDNSEKIEEFRSARTPPPPPPPQPPTEDIDDSSDSMTDVEQPPPLAGVVYIHNFDINIEEFINNLINNTDDDDL